MEIAVLREFYPGDVRVPLLPDHVGRLTQLGHRVHLEPAAGDGVGAPDQAYLDAGARLAPEPDVLFRTANLLLKIGPPNRDQALMLRRDHWVLSFLRLSCDLTRTNLLRSSGATFVACEAIGGDGVYPLAMAEDSVAGGVAADHGAALLDGCPLGEGSLEGRRALVVGEGECARAAASRARELGAAVRLIAAEAGAARALEPALAERGVEVLLASPGALPEAVAAADLVIAASRAAGPGRCRLALLEADLAGAREGEVVLDLGGEQGACVATTRPGVLGQPTRERAGVRYASPGRPAALDPAAASAAHSAALLAVLEPLLASGLRRATADPSLAAGLALQDGALHDRAAATAFGMRIGR